MRINALEGGAEVIAPADLTRERLLALRNEADRLGRECSFALEALANDASAYSFSSRRLVCSIGARIADLLDAWRAKDGSP